MTVDDFRRGMDALWASANRESDEFKDPYLPLDRLRALYQRLEPAERDLADRVLAEWLHSDSEAKRYDATALVREFRITEALPALRVLVKQLAKSTDPAARFEREKVEGVLEELGANGVPE